MPIPEVEKIWMDGELVDWKDATIHLLSHSLHYGSGVFGSDPSWFGHHSDQHDV